MCAYKLPTKYEKPEIMSVLIAPEWDRVIKKWNEEYLINVLDLQPYNRYMGNFSHNLWEYYMVELGNKKEFLKHIFTTESENDLIVKIMKKKYKNQEYWSLNQITWGMEDLDCSYEYPTEYDGPSTDGSEKLMEAFSTSYHNNETEEPLNTSHTRGAKIFNIILNSLERLDLTTPEDIKYKILAVKIINIQREWKRKLYNPHTELGKRFALKQIEWAYEE